MSAPIRVTTQQARSIGDLARLYMTTHRVDVEQAEGTAQVQVSSDRWTWLLAPNGTVIAEGERADT